MSQQIITRQDDGAMFLLGRRLGSGLLGIVYLGDSLTEDKGQVAVKTPFPDLAPAQRKRFKEEYDVLTSLAGQLDDPLPVSHVWWGENENTGAEVLILEYAPPELFGQVRELSGLTREELALQAAAQYARLLEALHELPRSDGGIEKGYTCADRKPRDLRWRAPELGSFESGRLMVLDWNVVRPKNEKGVRDDVYLFGSLWYQLLTDRYARSDPPVLDDQLWTTGDVSVSIGLRYLLARALAANPNRRYTDASKLAEAIEQQLSVLEKDGAELYEYGLFALQQAQRANDDVLRTLDLARQRQMVNMKDAPSLDLAAERRALLYLDLAVRKGAVEAEKDRDKAVNLVSRQGNRLVNWAAQAFEVVQYEAGARFLAWSDRVLQDAEELAAYDPELQLRVRRWQLLIATGRLAVSHGLELRNYIPQLVNAVADLERAVTKRMKSKELESDWARPAEQIKRVIDQLTRGYIDHSAAPFLKYLVREADVWVSLIHAEEERLAGNYEQAAEYVKEANRLLIVDKSAHHASQNYVAALRSILPDLKAERRDLLFRARTARVVNKLKQDLETGLGTGDPASIWYALWRLEEARRLFTGDEESLKELEAVARPEIMLALGKIDYLQAMGKWTESVEAICDLLSRDPDNEAVEYVDGYLRSAVNQVGTLAAENKPGSDKAALTLIDRLERARQLRARQRNIVYRSAS
jgi:hypothetical protein